MLNTLNSHVIVKTKAPTIFSLALTLVIDKEYTKQCI